MSSLLSKTRPMKNSAVKQNGFSLIELVVSIVVLGIAFGALSTSLFSAVGKGADTLWQSKATQLSQAYLDEILAMRYQEDSPLGGGPVVGNCSSAGFGTDAGETNRSLYDDVDDYHGLVETADFLDTAISSNYSGYQVSVSVICPPTGEPGLSVSKIISVTVTSPTNQKMVFSAFRANL